MSATCNKNSSFNHNDEIFAEVKDPLDNLDTYAEIPKYYRLNDKIFAEPIAILDENINDADVGNEICLINNIMVKKVADKRNKYLIDVNRTSSSSKCPQMDCNKNFSSTTLLRAHIRRVHCADRNKYICEHCGAGFSAGFLLRRHMAVHSEQRVKCPLCGKMLSRRTNMSVHLRRHANARPHACPLCRRAFLRRATLNTHLRFVHSTGELRCHRCDQRFSSRKLLSNHKSCQPN